MIIDKAHDFKILSGADPSKIRPQDGTLKKFSLQNLLHEGLYIFVLNKSEYAVKVAKCALVSGYLKFCNLPGEDQGQLPRQVSQLYAKMGSRT